MEEPPVKRARPEAAPAGLDLVRHVEELYRQQRLLLVLDIDNTLLESCNDPELMRMFQSDVNVSNCLTKLPGFSSFAIDMPTKPNSTYLIKLRDGAQDFLREMMQFFEVYIYTKGVRTYAHTAMELLAPNGGFPTRRIFARDDEIARDPNAGPDSKLLSYLFSSELMQAMTVVVDDRADVWSRHRAQLTWAWPFKFFGPRSKIRKPKEVKGAEPVLFEPGDQKAITDWLGTLQNLPQDNVLSNLGCVLKLLHQQFFAPANLSTLSPTPSARFHVDHLLSRVKASVLNGLHIVFSGLFPLHESQPASDLAQELWTLAKEFGAHCYKDMCEQVTHVVGARAGSAKMYQAAQMPGVYVVHYSWLQYSAAHYTRQDEYDFSFNDNRYEQFILSGRMGFCGALTLKGLIEAVEKVPKPSVTTTTTTTTTNPTPTTTTTTTTTGGGDKASRASKKKKSMQKWAQSRATQDEPGKPHHKHHAKPHAKSGDKRKASEDGEGAQRVDGEEGGRSGNEEKKNNNNNNNSNESNNISSENNPGNDDVSDVKSGEVKAAKAGGWRAGGGRRRNNAAAAVGTADAPSPLLTPAQTPAQPTTPNTPPPSHDVARSVTSPPKPLGPKETALSEAEEGELSPED